ncbi:KAT8 regulatory NSL complex subunit 2 [Aphelenchoides fujianensis]|nr:KAT8 regulatory NSL complex subunit 2 [Aphelenchoides fujianensis]
MDVELALENGEDLSSVDANDMQPDFQSSQDSQSTASTPHPTPKKKSQSRSQVCEFIDSEKQFAQCKQRAIVSYRYCIRHILADPTAPYKRCEQMVKSKNMQQCTNAIKADAPSPYCSTHLIMRGEKKPKKKKKELDSNGNSDGMEGASQNTQDSSSIADEDAKTSASDVDFSEIGKSPHDFLNADYAMPPPSNGVYGESAESAMVHGGHSMMGTPDSMHSSPSVYHETMRSPATALNKPPPQEVIIPLEPNGVHHPPMVIPIPSSQMLPHYVQRTPTKPENFEHAEFPLNGSTPVKPHRPLADHPHEHRMAVGPVPHFVPVPRVEFVEPQPHPRHPKLHVVPLKSPLEFIDRPPPPVHYDAAAIRVDDQRSEVERILQEYLNEDEKPSERRKSNVIKLQQKRRRIRTDGSFRSIPAVDAMCQVVEDFDFDSTDLFPLGLEPSDDEDSSDEEPGFSHLPAVSVDSKDFRASRIELYLMKKRLRRESEKLQKNAKLSLAVMQAAKSFPDSVGAAFRQRALYRHRRNLGGLNSAQQRCFHVERNTRVRCANVCVPRSTLCVEHIAFNLHQRAFSFCSAPCCGRTVSKLNALVFKGVCEDHYRGNQNPPPQNGMIPNGHVHRLPPPVADTHSTAHLEQVHMPIEGALPPDNFADHQLMNSISMDDFNVTDVIEGDVSLASVANELLFDNNMSDLLHAVDEPLSGVEHAVGELEDGDAMHPIPMDDAAHSWQDICEFLHSEGCFSGNEQEFQNNGY